MGEEVLPTRSLWMKLACGKEDVIAGGEGTGLNLAGQVVCRRINMNADRLEVVAESGLHEPACFRRKGLSTAAASIINRLGEMGCRG